MLKKLIDLLHDLDMDEIDIVKKLAKDFIEWCKWNKSYKTIEILEPKEFKTIIVVHNLWEYNQPSIYDSWDFLKDVVYFIDEYCCENEEDLKYCYDFWINKLNGQMK